MAKSKLLAPIFYLMVSFFAEAQVNRYMIFFTDKDNSTYSTDRPEEFLSERSIARRQRQGITVDDSDLPVNESYVQVLIDQDVEVFFETKWLNGVLVQSEESELPVIQSQVFVREIELVARKDRLLNPTPKSGRLKSILTRNRSSRESESQNAMLSVDEMHNRDYFGEGVMIAVFDGGFDNVNEIEYFSHIFDEERMAATYDFVTNSGDVFQFDNHGTRVFSAIAGFADGGFNGTAYKADYILCVTEDGLSEFRIEEYNWLFAAEFADSVGVDIINTSLGYNVFDDSNMNYTHEDLDGKTALITQASNIAAEKGILLVASAGNEGDNSWGKITPPADSPYVIAVGGITDSGDLSGFSSLGPTADERIKPDVVALGTDVTLIGSNGGIVTSDGTSFSSPLVAGLAAGIWQARPELTNFELIDLIRMSADNTLSPDNFMGYGVPDFLKAVGNQVLSVDDIIKEKIKVYPNPFRGNRIFIDVDSKLSKGGLEIELYNLSGSLIAQKNLVQTDLRGVVEFEIDSFIAPGTYLLKVITRNKINQVKLIKY